MTKDLQFPHVHLNGTSRHVLLCDLHKASEALDVAYGKLKRTAPNGRDYYPLGPDAIERAIAQHTDRLARLDAIKAEIDAIIGEVSDGL